MSAYTHIYQNSYVMSAIILIILLLVFYFFDIGSKIQVSPDGTITKKFNWKMPIALTLIFWVIWHYLVYPPPGTTLETPAPSKVKQIKPISNIGSIGSIGASNSGKKLPKQQFDMNNWN